MIKFIKRYWLLNLASLAAILFVINKVLENNAPVSNIPTPISTSVAAYRSLLPGSSTQDQVNKLLGFPVKEEKTDNKTLAEYQSANQYRNHDVIFENSVVILIKEKIISS